MSEGITLVEAIDMAESVVEAFGIEYDTERMKEVRIEMVEIENLATDSVREREKEERIVNLRKNREYMFIDSLSKEDKGDALQEEQERRMQEFGAKSESAKNLLPPEEEVVVADSEPCEKEE